MCHARRMLAPLAALLALAAPAPGQVMFTVIDIGPPGASVATTFGINNANQVVGDYAFLGGSPYVTAGAFRWDPVAGRTDLSSAGLLSVTATAINDNGQIAGTGQVSANGTHAYRTTPNGLVFGPGGDLGAFSNLNVADAYGINARGQVTGVSRVPTPPPYEIPPMYIPFAGVRFAFRTSQTGTLADPAADLGAYDGIYSAGYGINASGQVVGESSTFHGGSVHAFRTSPTGRVTDPGTDLGTLGGTTSTAYGINDSGQVTGKAYTANGQSHAFRTTATGRISDPGTDLGTLGGSGSEGRGINALVFVVGTSSTATGASHAFLYDDQMWDLNDLIAPVPGLVLTTVSSINDNNWIAGEANVNGIRHAVVLEPTAAYLERVQSLIAVPEPSGLALLGAAAGLACRRLRRKTARL